ncbi:MAG: hypothetical protein HQ463_00895 [Bacteroidetes bacterium]|nr:hypothetical protein [Bacteroidota bacterium]
MHPQYFEQANGTLEQKVKSVFAGKLSSTNFTVSNVISFNIEGNSNSPIVALIIEVPKS